MRREVRILLGVLAGLLVLLAVIVVRKMTGGSDLPPAALPAGATSDADDEPPAGMRPIIVATDRASRSAEAPVAPTTIESTESGAAPSGTHDHRPPHVSFMPRTATPPLSDGESSSPQVSPDEAAIESPADDAAGVAPAPSEVETTPVTDRPPNDEQPPIEVEQPVELPKQRLVAPSIERARIKTAQPTNQDASSQPATRDRYVVRSGDTLWSIAQRASGSGAYFRALAQFNRERVSHADEVKTGTELALPDIAELQRRFPQLCPKAKSKSTFIAVTDAQDDQAVSPPPGSRIYVVEEGDTLSEIARYELGDAAKWETIAQANRRLLGGDANQISPGMKLVLPPKSSNVAAKTPSRPTIGEPEVEAAAIPPKMKNLKR
jgi:nucleoid-associated protein YgaU